MYNATSLCRVKRAIQVIYLCNVMNRQRVTKSLIEHGVQFHEGAVCQSLNMSLLLQVLGYAVQEKVSGQFVMNRTPSKIY
jgi:hypothetical protein